MIKVILISLLAIVCLSGCSPVLSKTSPLAATQEPETTPPQRGLRVIEVFPNSPAQAAGLQMMDLITQYGGYQIVDKASYFAAREKYEKSQTPSVEIVAWRGRERMTAKVSTGWLGVSTIERDRVSLEFAALMNQVNLLSQIPEYQRKREFKEAFENGGIPVILERAKTLIDQAERDGTLTTSQILIARIDLILDDAPEHEQNRQLELLQALFRSQPVSFIEMLGNDKFFKDRRYRPASACIDHYLNSAPDDVSMRLNLAVAYNEIGKYDEAERQVNYVFSRNLPMSSHGHVVAYSASAIAALGRRDYAKSVESIERALARDVDRSLVKILQLAAALLGDRARFDRAAQMLKQAAPAEDDQLKLQRDAAEAYLLVKENRRADARQIVEAWKTDDRAEGKVSYYWSRLPNGMDIAKTWAELSKQQLAKSK